MKIWTEESRCDTFHSERAESKQISDTCLTAQDKYKAYLDYFRIAY